VVFLRMLCAIQFAKIGESIKSCHFLLQNFT